MNRIEALQAAFNIAGPNVTAEEHIQYAEFLLGDQNVTYIKDWITVADTKSICDDRVPEADSPTGCVYKRGEKVYEGNDDIYPIGAVALDDDMDIHVKVGPRSWDRYDKDNGLALSDTNAWNAQHFNAVFVA